MREQLLGTNLLFNISSLQATIVSLLLAYSVLLKTLQATPLEASSGMQCFFSISFGRVVVLSPKIIINLPRTYEKLLCKGEPYRFSGQLDPSVQTDSQRFCYFYERIMTLNSNTYRKQIFFFPIQIYLKQSLKQIRFRVAALLIISIKEFCNNSLE